MLFRSELGKNRIVVVAGFQGVNEFDDITTLGRGGSDTTAVALAAALHADKCQIYTDVEGVFTADPRKVPKAHRHETISYDEMLELAKLGSQVLHSRSVELAQCYGVVLEVLSSYVKSPSTRVGAFDESTEKAAVTGITADRTMPDAAKVSIVGRGLTGTSGAVEIMLQALGEADIDARPLPAGERSFSALVPKEEADRAVRVIHRKLFEE